MYDPYGLLTQNPDSTWVAHLKAKTVGSALKHLLESAAEQLDWFDESAVDDAVEVIAVASALASLFADGSEQEQLVPVPVRVAVLAARHIDEAAERFKTSILMDPYTGDFVRGGRYIVTNMHHVAGDLRNAAGAI